MDSQVEQENKIEEKKSSRKKGAFPRLPLKKVIELPLSVYKDGQGEQVRRLQVFQSLGKSAESSLSRTLVTVSSLYGLTTGSYKSEYLHLTGRGKEIAQTILSGKKALGSIYDVLFSNDIFSGFINYWKNKYMPSDEIASDWISRNYNLSREDGVACWNVVKQNINDYELSEVLSGKQSIRSRDDALKIIPIIEGQEISSEENVSENLQEAPADSLVKTGQNLEAEMRKPLGAQMVERNFKYGRARIMLPTQMTKSEIAGLSNLIKGLVEEIDE